MKIRPLQETDFQAINELSAQLGYSYPMEKTKTRMDYVINHPDHWAYVAEEQETGKVVGFIHFALYTLLYFDHMFNVLGLVVDQDARGSGVGTKLLEVVEKVALENGCDKLRAASGMTRDHAHDFYIKHGFFNQKDQKRFIKDLKN